MEDKAKYGLQVLNSTERNVLLVALDHLQEHLESLAEDTSLQFSKELNACKDLQKALK